MVVVAVAVAVAGGRSEKRRPTPSVAATDAAATDATRETKIPRGK